jgi:DNA-directed RNA polymerase subunit RPC12/RpoP
MKKGTCPDCNSTEVYKTDFAPLQAGGSLLLLYNSNGRNFPLEVYLCAACGRMEINVAEKDVVQLSELVKSDNWKKV